MFSCKPWARALINSIDKVDDDFEEIIVRFFKLLVRKKRVRYINPVMTEVKNILNRRQGIITVCAEYAFPPQDGFESSLCELIKKQTGASGVELAGCVKPELIGGYRLRIGDKIIDASIRGQLRKMKGCLMEKVE